MLFFSSMELLLTLHAPHVLVWKIGFQIHGLEEEAQQGGQKDNPTWPYCDYLSGLVKDKVYYTSGLKLWQHK